MNTLIDFDGAAVVAVPVLAGFSEHGDRECMLLEGPQGWGEFGPPRDVDDRAAGRWLTAATEPGTVGWPDPVRGRVAVAIGVPAVDADRAAQLVADSGCTTAEVWVGSLPTSDGTLAADLARVQAVRDALGAAGRIRCVAAGRWDPETAADAIGALTRAAGGLEYVEQPCRTLDELAELRRRVDVPIAADATPMQSPGPQRVSFAEAVDVAVLRCGALGGVRRSLRVAEASGLPCVVASDRETSVGLAGAAALAGALPELPFACRVGRPPWVVGDVVPAGRALIPEAGYLPVAPMPPAPDPGLLARYAVTDPDTLRRWRTRLRAVRAAQ